VLRQGVTLAGIGVVIGILGARAVTPFVQSMLYNVTPTDLASFAGVAIFLVAVAITASYIPARRATAVEAIIAIRDQ
jgi:ABC-type antimicrobial peptide transport system permease subunit